jgi:predicted enzyme related to lactoylglutathione lyase
MKPRTLLAAAGALALANLLPAHAQSPKGSPVLAPLVFFDIAGPDTGALNKFYATVFGWTFEPWGATSAPLTTAGVLPGTLRQDPAEKVLYFGVDDIDATLKAITAAGGQVAAPRYEVPGVVIMALFLDPAGNRMGLVEMENGKAKIP